MSLRQRHRFNAQLSDPDQAPTLVIWVIGESSRPQNWSLFKTWGYPRDTTPRLRARTDILPLPGMRATAPYTSAAVPSMLSLSPITQWQQINATKSVVTAFAEAGYQTAWIENQPCDVGGGIIPLIAVEASQVRYLGRRALDGETVAALGRLLNARKPQDKLFVVIHLMGSHFEYDLRYPPDHARFAPRTSSRKERLVAQYDNSLLYSDFVLDRLIETVRQTQLPGLLVFSSDHGENLLDDDRQLWAHGIGTEYDLRAAALFWFSEALWHTRREAIRNASRHRDDPIDLSYLAHAVLDFTGIRADGLDPQKSLFNREFKLHPYTCMVHGRLVTLPPSARLDATGLD